MKLASEWLPRDMRRHEAAGRQRPPSRTRHAETLVYHSWIYHRIYDVIRLRQSFGPFTPSNGVHMGKE